ncbi:DUF2931 family protein [Capnocytophaga gingivalis]|uniref:DUF2931 family protein n=1 Tax=Capnocytophaga gingivalis TaxID=1017 RepID=A0ABU5ZCM6_9FLAO|nr:DUF2931 family protein [Capnocytophaga gingivalis]MEB3075492.1 DUF2931 family protein [Capnocytophaga gingivalis]
MIKPILFITFILIALWLTGCWGYKAKQNKANANAQPEYEWGVAVNTPIGYPIRFYAGRVGGMSIIGELYSELREPDWGCAFGYESTSMDKLPKSVDMVWLSYKEDCFYRLKTAIDYEKIAKLFREGFNQRVPNGEVRHATYNTVVVGIAPGGVVVLWVGKGYFPIKEIGRYQADKIVLKEPEGLDNHQKLIFDKEYAKRLLTNNTIIPEDFREANKNKPIPFGLWDSYRDNQYQWYPTFEIPNGKMGDVDYQYWNGEADTFFFTDFITLEEYKDVFVPKELYRDIRELPLFKEIRFTYKAEDGIKYGVGLQFDWEDILATYKKVFGEHPEEVKAHLDIRINRDNTYLTVRLMGDNGKEAFVEPKLIDIGEANQKYAPPFDN